jgi:hypothetical protein
MFKKAQILIFSLLSFLFVIELAAQVNVDLPVAREDFSIGEAVYQIMVADVTGYNVTSFQFNIYYDKAVIYITKASTSGLQMSGGMFTAYNADTANGKISVAAASSKPISGFGALINITVKFRSKGSSVLTFIDQSNGNNTFMFNAGTPYAVTSNGGITITPASDPTLLLLSPNGGEIWEGGSLQQIRWTSSNLSSLKIDYSIDSGLNWESVTGNVNAAAGEYAWSVPNLNSKSARIKISDMFNELMFDVSDYDFEIKGTTLVESFEKNTASNFRLYQNYPNPFNPTTIISYELPENGHVVLKVTDVSGREIATLIDEYKSAGVHSISFDPLLYERDLSSGVYIYWLSAGELVLARKMVLLR